MHNLAGERKLRGKTQQASVNMHRKDKERIKRIRNPLKKERFARRILCPCGATGTGAANSAKSARLTAHVWRLFDFIAPELALGPAGPHMLFLG